MRQSLTLKYTPHFRLAVIFFSGFNKWYNQTLVTHINIFLTLDIFNIQTSFFNSLVVIR